MGARMLGEEGDPRKGEALRVELFEVGEDTLDLTCVSSGARPRRRGSGR